MLFTAAAEDLMLQDVYKFISLLTNKALNVFNGFTHDDEHYWISKPHCVLKPLLQSLEIKHVLCFSCQKNINSPSCLPEPTEYIKKTTKQCIYCITLLRDGLHYLNRI